MCQGPFNRPKLPGIPGITEFKGHTFHTARWDYEYTGGDLHGGLDRLAGKRSRSSAPAPADRRRSRTSPSPPSTCTCSSGRRRTSTSAATTQTDPEWVEDAEAGLAGRAAAQFPHRGVRRSSRPGEPDLVCDGWTEVSRNLAAHLDATNGWAALDRRRASCELRETEDYRAMERVRDRVDAIVEDQKTADALEALLPLPVQAAVLQRRVPADLQPRQRHPRRRVGHQGRRTHHRERHRRRRRRIRGRLHHLRQRLRDHDRPRPSPSASSRSRAARACRSTTTGATASGPSTASRATASPTCSSPASCRAA